MTDLAIRAHGTRGRALRRLLANKLFVAGSIVIAIFYVLAILAPVVSPYDPYALDLGSAFAPPFSGGHLLGTDNFGRDILSRLIHGSRISLIVGLIVVLIAATIGTALGLLAGYIGGWVDVLIMRAVEIFFAFPFLILVIAVIAVLGPNLINVVLVLGLVSWPYYTRLVRAQVLSLRDREYVEAARAYGASPTRVMFRHILPNSLTPVIVAATFGIPQAILALAALGFLGLGAQPPTPEWGAMVSIGKDFILEYPLLITWPGLCIMLVVMSFNFLGDGLRDVLDPRSSAVRPAGTNK
jgi:peptide/nickel transport system permease protein